MHVVVPNHRTSRGALAVLVVTAALSVLATGVIHAAPASADPTPSCDATTCTVGFGTAGTTQQWTVPAGVSTITVSMAGGSGGSSAAGGVGGPGGAMVATVPVFSGENLSVLQGTSPFPGGDFGGGGAPGGSGPGQTGGWGGGGSFVFETNPTATLLLAVGGGGGAGGDAGEVAGTGGSNGPGSDATSTFEPTVVGLGGTLAAGGAGGAGIAGPFANGSAGGGPAMAPSNPGAGGSGGSSVPAGRELGRGRRRGLLRRRWRRRQRSGGHLCGSGRRRFGLQRPEHHRALHFDQHRRRLGHHHLPRPGNDDDLGSAGRRRHRCSDPQQLRRVLTGRLPRPDQLHQRGGRRHVVLHHGRVRPVQPGLLHHGQRRLQPTDPAHTRALVVHQPAVERDR